MTRSAKLGITSVVLLLIALVTPFINWRFPIAFISGVLSVLLAALAAQQGSRWWLMVPGVIIAEFSLGLYVGFHSF
jgi:uncharacterized membrane protein